MANPFLVLGGIAVGIITAAFGVLAVPGWVASAQDAAATNDVSQLSLAQAASISENARYQPTLASLLSLGSVKASPSSTAAVGTATDATGKHSVTLAKSDSGRYFARISGKAAIGSGLTADDAVRAAGTTVVAGRTAEGVQVPVLGAGVVARNLFPNPLTDSLSSASSMVGQSELSLITDFPRGNGTAIRSIRTSSNVATRHVNLHTRAATPFGHSIRFTALLRASESIAVQVSVRENVHLPYSVVPDEWVRLAAGVVTPVDITFPASAPLTAVYESGISIRGGDGTAGSTLDIANVSIERADRSAGFFHGGSGTIGGAVASWAGTPGQSESILTR